MTFASSVRDFTRLGAPFLVGLFLASPSLGAQATATDSFPRPDRPVSRIVAPRWVAEDRRDAFGEAEQVMKALRIGPGMRVADIGAGDGYYVQRLAERVGPSGLVFGEDIEPRYLELLRDRVESAGWKNVRVIEGTAGDPAIPAGSIDVALMIHMYHEITEPFALLHRLAPAFRAGGRLAVLDLDGPTDQHGTPPRLLACELGALGYERVRREVMADGAYLIIFRAPDEATRTKNATEVRARVSKASCKA
ncbi:MAG: class I SAM-dependent methyltransferase [Gemmatimonadaceae bacterium]